MYIFLCNEYFKYDMRLFDILKLQSKRSFGVESMIIIDCCICIYLYIIETLYNYLRETRYMNATYLLYITF